MNAFHVIAKKSNPALFVVLLEEMELGPVELKRLLNRGVTNGGEGSDFMTPLFFAVPNIDLMKLYLSYGADGSRLSFNLTFRAFKKYRQQLQYLVSNSDLHVDNRSVIDACVAHDAEALDFLLELGADLDI